ncbi:MAG TPA: FdhF/YdeP family oxidoreductase [Bdellovibrionota bacterium]|nr:FdhF/YdeP family oxidoreductase [Bdellovibrionota bacterium]
MKLRHLVPFGILESQKPKHFRSMLNAAWANRDSLGYGWRILKHGVCDGCSLGPYGLKDNVMNGIHLCMTRLNLLRLNTMGPFDPDRLPDVEGLRQMTNEELHALGRIPAPLRLRRGESRFRRIDWNEAFTTIGSTIKKLRSDGKSDRIGMYVTSRGLTNETYYLARKLSSLIGTNNIDLCARLCHAASVDGLKDTLGVGAPTCSLSDLIGSDLVVIFGSNLANNQPVTMKYLHYAKKRGTKVLVINPYREPGLERYWVPSVPSSALFGTKIMDDFFQVSIGGDIAFMNGVLKALVQTSGVDEKFISRATSGFDELKAHVNALSWAMLEENSGLQRVDMERFARIYSRARSAVFVYSMGLTQHRFGVDNVKSIVNLALARGMLGKEKCGILPIRGHSGVQGGGECGIDPGKLPGNVPLTPESAAYFEREWGEPVAQSKGLRIGQMLEAAFEGKISMLYNVGGNLFETMPDPDYMREAMQRVPFRVHQDIVLNRSTVLEGDDVLLLPAQTRYEQKGGGTSTNTERRIRFTPEIPGHPVGEARSEWEILSAVGRQIFPNAGGPFSFSDAQVVRDEMGRVMPMYNGIQNLQKEGDQLQWGGKTLFAGGTFSKMPNGRARFSAISPPKLEIPEGCVYVTTRRGKQFNSMTYGSNDPLTNRKRTDIFVSGHDADRLGLQEGEKIRLRSDVGQMDGTCRIAPIPPRNVQVHWPEGNVLIARRYDPVSFEPDYNAVARIEKIL